MTKPPDTIYAAPNVSTGSRVSTLETKLFSIPYHRAPQWISVEDARWLCNIAEDYGNMLVGGSNIEQQAARIKNALPQPPEDEDAD